MGVSKAIKIENITVLLNHEADFNKTNTESSTYALHYATKFSDKITNKFSVGKGISVNVMDYDYKTPLSWACQKANNIENVSTLLQHGADNNKTNKESGACVLH